MLVSIFRSKFPNLSKIQKSRTSERSVNNFEFRRETTDIANLTWTLLRLRGIKGHFNDRINIKVFIPALHLEILSYVTSEIYDLRVYDKTR